jgi:hypothetical protein
MIQKFVHSVLPALLLLALSLFATVSNAHAADQVVSDCGDNGGANQLRQKITDAQNSGGGTITFKCGTATIVLQNGALPTITGNITIDGGNQITISGNNVTRIFIVNGGATLTLQNIVLTNANVGGNGAPSSDGGAIYNSGLLILTHATIQNSQVSTANSGGAIVTYGELHIINSTIAGNLAGNGGAIYARYAGAQVTITLSSLHDNQTTNTTNGFGGAILLWDGAAVSISDSTLDSNKASYGGALYNSFSNSSITVQNSQLTNNNANNQGGALDTASGPASLTNTVLSGNHAGGAGGGIYNDLGTQLTLTSVTLVGNSAGGGGGIFNYHATATLTNVTFSGNSATAYGGGLNNNHDATATLTNVTFFGNQAPLAGGIHNEEEHHPNLYLTNVLLAKGPSGNNCNFATLPMGSLFNLSDDSSCNFGVGRDAINLMLGPLGNHGGLTPTHLPSLNPKSPAIDKGTPSNGAPSVDQRGITRPQGAAFDVGAVEVCATKPVKATLLKPANGKKTKGPQVTLDWNDVPCATSYVVLVKLGSPTGSQVQKKAGLTDSTFTTKKLVKGQTYYWQITAVGDAGKTKSDWWSFQVK